MPIFDQGYQHWQGKLAGHGWRWLAITRHGVRVGLQNKFLRLLLLGSLIPALLLAGAIAVWGMVEQKSSWAMTFLGRIEPLRDLVQDPASYRLTAWTLCFHFFLNIEMLIIMLLVLLVGPSLISQDLRFNALPLYFSRPVRRIDYFVGKLGVIGFFLMLVAVVPAVAAWLLGLLFSLDVSAIFTTFHLLLGMALTGLIITLSAGLLVLALSSLSRNSRYVGMFWAGIWIITGMVSGMLEAIHQSSVRHEIWRDDWWQLQHKIQNEEQQLHMDEQVFDHKPLTPEKPTPQQKQEKEEWEARERQRKQQKQERLERLAQLKIQLKKADEDMEKRQEEAEAALQHDWRPLISYTANLQRIGFALIGSQEAFDKVDELTGLRQKKQPHHDPFRGPRNLGPRMGAIMVPQYPWYWSAIVLIVLGGISLWILNKRVTSLDQLR